MAHINPAVLNSTQTGTPKPNIKLIICATPRTASTTLVRLLESAGLGHPTEYFNHGIVSTLAQKWGVGKPASSLAALSQYQDMLYCHAQQNGVFAVKLHFNQFRKFLMNPVGRDLFADAKIVFLIRNNLAHQAASFIVAQQTKHFQADDSRQQLVVPCVTSNLVDAVVELAQDEMNWRRFFANANITAHYLTDKDIATQPIATVQAIAQWIGVTPDLASLRLCAGQLQKYERHHAEKIRMLENDLPPLAAMAFDRNTYSSKHPEISRRQTPFRHLIARLKHRMATKK